MRVIELSTKDNKDGKRNIKVILHEIYKDKNKWNENGITWLEEYCEKNIESIKGMSITCEFTNEERTEILGHGDTGIKEGEPLCENATMIGVIEKGYIEEMEIEGEKKKVCVGEGYLDATRYRKFVDILERRHKGGEVVYGSVEIIGEKGNNNIIKYLEGYKEEGRIPTEYRYSGYAILGVAPADKTARLIEINKRKENVEMDELKKLLNELKSKLDKTDEYKKESEKNQKEVEEIRKSKEELEKEIKELKEENETLSNKLKEHENNSDSLKKELDELKSRSLKNELDSALADFTEAQMEFAKEAIEEFAKDPLNSANTIQDIVNTILWNIGKETLELKKKVREQNSKENSNNDILGEVLEEQNKNEISIF